MTVERRRGFSVRVFLPDGDPDGLKVVEKSNWNGCGLVIPRTLFGVVKSRPELARPGVYVLVGETTDSPLPVVYVGEADSVRARLERHGREEDFWTHVVVFTSKDQNLNKAHVKYLEARLVSLATTSKRCLLGNTNIPRPPSLSESDTAEVDGFLDDMLLCLPVLGISYFEPPASAALRDTQLLLTARGLVAQGYDTTQGFIVLKNSHALKTESNAILSYLAELRRQLLQQGVLRDAGPVYEFTQDYTFDSPSMASGVLLGRSSNGRVEWKTADGRTLKSIQDAEID